MKYLKYIFLILIFLTALGFFTFRNLLENHVFESSQEIQYVIDCDFAKVKKVLMRTNVLEEIVSKEHGKIIDKKWENFIVSSKRIFRDGIDIDADGYFVVEKNDFNEGIVQLKFIQKVHTTKDELTSNTYLNECCNHFKEIKTELSMVPFGDKKTLATTKMFLKYERLVPKNMIDKIKNTIKLSVADSLQNNKSTVANLVNRYADKQFIIPFNSK
jgi:hypothetical protein